MEKLINISENMSDIFTKYKEKYPNLGEFEYNSNDDTLIYKNKVINNASNAIQHTSPSIYQLIPDSIFDYLKNGFYYDRTSEILKIKSMIESEILITEEEYNILINFVKQYLIRFQIYVNNNLLFNNQNIAGTSALSSFLKDFNTRKKIIDSVRNHSSLTNTAIQIINNEYNKYTNNNQENFSLEKPLTLNRKKTSEFNYEFKEQSEIDAIYEKKQKLGVSGFTSIILILITTVSAGTFLALNLIK